MTAVEHIQAAQQRQIVDKRGKPLSLDFYPPLTPDEIGTLEGKVGVPLPAELRSLLGVCAGIDGLNGCVQGIHFAGENMDFEMKEIFPYGLPFALDGCGNFWVLDLTPETRTAAPVFFASHDAPVILYQSPDLATFLSELFKMYTPPHKSLVDDVYTDRLFEIWRRNPEVIEYQTAVTSSDSVLKAFATELSGDFQFIDLRDVEPGMGFSWGRYGPRTEIRRHRHERVFAYSKPAKKRVSFQSCSGAKEWPGMTPSRLLS